LISVRRPSRQSVLFVWTNAKLLVRTYLRYSMTQALFMPFTNTGLAIVIAGVPTN
jgi:hypothetical protein